MPTPRILVVAQFLVTSSTLVLWPNATRADGEASSPQAPTSDDSAAADSSSPQDVPPVLDADAYADTDPSALADFRPTLDPHGTWADDPQFGLVWAPNVDEVGTDFRPYVSAGHWAYGTDYVWVSDYEWGWAAFHYGRWVWIAATGWAWIPGRAYAGAWVAWRVGEDGFEEYVGWAPMPPSWIWRGGVAVWMGAIPWTPFTFCPSREMFAPALATRVVVGDPATAIASHTRRYVRARPAVGARPPVQGEMHGPAPSLLGINPSLVAHLTGKEHGLMRAWQYARPSTAQTMGALVPASHVVRPMPVTVRYDAPRQAPRPQRRK